MAQLSLGLVNPFTAIDAIWRLWLISIPKIARQIKQYMHHALFEQMHLSQDNHAHRTPVTGITGAFAHYCMLVALSHTKKFSAKDELWRFSC